MNGYEFKRPISTGTEYLNFCQDETNASMCSGAVLINNDTSEE
jgi:hypothetical protein